MFLSIPGWIRHSAIIISLTCLMQTCVWAESLHRIGNTLIPQAFSEALQEGMSLPVYIHLDNTVSATDDVKAGRAFIWMDKGLIRVKRIQLDYDDTGVVLSHTAAAVVEGISDVPFSSELQIEIGASAHLQLNVRQLMLQLVIKRGALGTVMISRGENLGQSSTTQVSNSLRYDTGMSSSRMRNDSVNTSTYVSLHNITSLREHHVVTDASFYGLGSTEQETDLHKVMYERDYAGHRFSGGMLDTWNLQSLGPVTALSAGRIYGVSWGNQANSTQFDNTQSSTPVIAFFPAAGEVHLSREGRLISIQNFNMGNHEVDTRGLPYGIYDVLVEVFINGKSVSHSQQRVNKLFGHGSGSLDRLSWQMWGGRFYKERWLDGSRTLPNEESWLAGVSLSGSQNEFSWAATGYSETDATTAEARAELPISSLLSISVQSMLSSDGSSGTVTSMNSSLPGDFSSVWMSQEKTHAGSKLRRCSSDNRAIGTTVNMNALISELGTFSVSYNDDVSYGGHYYNADYSQNLFSGPLGSLSVRLGVQRYSNGSANTSAGKFIALDFSLPLGNWFSAGVTNQNGYTIANASARMRSDDGIFRTTGVNLSRSVSGYSGDDKTLTGGAYTQFETPYSDGSVNLNSGATGYTNINVNAGGTVGWTQKDIAASGRTEGDAGLILKTDIDNDGDLSARVNGRVFQLRGKHNYLPLPAYGRYEVELQNSQNSSDSYDISAGRRSSVTLYPGNISVIEPKVKQMVTVSGRVRNSQGQPLPDIVLSNRLGGARTDGKGEFIMDLDKKNPVITISNSRMVLCTISLPVAKARGAIWLGDIVCVNKNHLL